MLKTQINDTLDNPNVNRSNVISFLDFKHRKEHQGLNDINEYLRKAEVLDRLLKYEEAMEAYDKAIALEPDYIGALSSEKSICILKKHKRRIKCIDRVTLYN